MQSKESQTMVVERWPLWRNRLAHSASKATISSNQINDKGLSKFNKIVRWRGQDHLSQHFAYLATVFATLTLVDRVFNQSINL